MSTEPRRERLDLMLLEALANNALKQLVASVGYERAVAEAVPQVRTVLIVKHQRGEL